MICDIDTETRSATPIMQGNDNYTADAECMIVTWALGDQPVRLWDRMEYPEMPADLKAIFADESIILVAQNAAFDRCILERSLGLKINITRWRCTKAQAYSHSLPGSLETMGKVLGLTEGDAKMGEGKKLIQLFCTPARYSADGSPQWNTWGTHPAEWKTFCDYAVRDTHALRLIRQKLPQHNYSGENLAAWHLDQLINERGFLFDEQLALAARKALQAAKGHQDKQSAITTSGAVQAPTQRVKLLHWFQDNGLDMANLQAATVREMLESDDIAPEVRFMLELRMEASKSSGAKYGRGLTMMGKDQRIRYALQFNGAGRTGRWSGRGFQPHNMPRPQAKFEQIVKEIEALKGGMLDLISDRGANTACADMLRSAIIAAPGNELTVADYSNIESRILAWLADEKWKLEAYRAADAGTGKDLYRLLFAAFFGTPVDEVTDKQRQSGKVSELAFGFGGGVGALVTMAAGYNMDLDALPDLVLPSAKPEHLKRARTNWRRAFMKNEDYGLEARTYMACDILKQVYRASNANIDTMRQAIDDATKGAVKVNNTLFTAGKCKIWRQNEWLIIELPSGRRLLYSNPEILVERETDVETGKVSVYESITYMSARGVSWTREKAWSGLFVENIVQAVANDILRAGLLNVHRSVPHAMTPIVLHVHDEVVCELPKGTLSVDRLVNLLTTDVQSRTPWMKDLPLAAAGWVGTRYRK